MAAHGEARGKNWMLALGVLLGVLACFFAMPWIWRADPESVAHVAVWNLTSLERELLQNVYGQEDAVKKIMRTIRDVMIEPERSRHHQVVFLLGGPGVGKSHTFNILSKHITSNSSDNSSCEITFEKRERCYREYYNEESVPGVWTYFKSFKRTERLMLWATDFQYLDIYINDQELIGLVHQFACQGLYSRKRAGINERTIYFMTGRIFNESVMIDLRSEKDYQRYLDDALGRLDRYMARNVDFTVSYIRFKSLSPQHVARCLADREEGATNEEIAEIIQRNGVVNEDHLFVPNGCKVY